MFFTTAIKTRIDRLNNTVVERFISPRQWWFNRLIWGILASVLLIDILWAAALGWSYDWHNVTLLVEILAPLALLCWVFARLYVRPEFELMMHIALQLLLLVFISAFFNYVTATLNRPLYDDTLIAIDRALGFDWHAYVWWVREHADFSRFLTISYASAWAQCIVLVLLLFFTGRTEHLQRFMFCILVGALITSVLAALFPAVAGYVHYNIDLATLPGHYPPAAARAHEAELMAVRNGTFHKITLEFKGLVTFPSFHTTFGLLLIYAAWVFRWLRWPVLLLNLALVLSVPVDGGHYLVDALAGALLAVCMVWWADKLLPKEKNHPQG